MKGKFFEYQWSVKKTDSGYIWNLWGEKMELLQSSTDEDQEEKHFETDVLAREAVYDVIRDFYN